MQRFIFLFLVLLGTSCFALKSDAASLIMVEQKACEYCAAWDQDIGVIYAKTPEGEKAPLRRIDIHAALPDDLKFLQRLVFTPTFVLVHDNKEIGRISGYPGEDFFWGLLQKMLQELPNKKVSSAFIGN